VASRIVHTYDDGLEETARMYAGTLHPAAQAAPCDCGSGERYVDCCLSEIAAQACPCGSGSTFVGCCSLHALERGSVGTPSTHLATTAACRA